MAKLLKGLGLAGVIGAAIGIALVSLIHPTTEGGTLLLLVAPVLLSLVIGGVVAWVGKSSDKPKSNGHAYDTRETTLHLVGGERNKALIDIVFLHGLGGHPKKTWMYNEADDETFWPNWLVHDLPDACVWSAEYPADPAKWIGGGGRSIPLQTVVFALLDRLAQKDLGKRPIVLVSHSLGGLVAKQLVRAAAERTSSQDWRSIGSAIKGVVFISTPHAGSSLADFILGASRVLVPGLFAKGTASLLDLQTNSIVLNQLSDWYQHAAHTDGIATLAYYEELPTSGVMVVPLDSANPHL